MKKNRPPISSTTSSTSDIEKGNQWMTVYKLFLESGPKHKKTMVHIAELLGCVVTGPTTEEALNRTPDGIRAYLRFLKRHGERVNPDGEVQTEIVAHFTEGIFLGQGDPSLIIG